MRLIFGYDFLDTIKMYHYKIDRFVVPYSEINKCAWVYDVEFFFYLYCIKIINLSLEVGAKKQYFLDFFVYISYFFEEYRLNKKKMYVLFSITWLKIKYRMYVFYQSKSIFILVKNKIFMNVKYFKETLDKIQFRTLFVDAV